VPDIIRWPGKVKPGSVENGIFSGLDWLPTLAAAGTPDATDRLAAQLAREGDPEPIHIEETNANFAIDWKGHYRIEGDAFVFVDRKTRGTRAILGYATQKLQHIGRG
jgi:arylsulfatase A-like enzyme